MTDVQTLIADLERSVDTESGFDSVVGRARRRRRHRRVVRAVSALGVVTLAGVGIAVAQRTDETSAPTVTTPAPPAAPLVEVVPSPFGPDGDLDTVIAVGPDERMAFGSTAPNGPTLALRGSGDSWGTPVELGAGAAPVLDAAFDGTTIVALTDTLSGTRAWRSTDGRDWSSAELPGVASAFTLFGAPEVGFVAGGASADQIAVWSSADGTTWRLDELAPRPYDIRGITASGGDVVVVGLRGTRGASWRRAAGSMVWEGGATDDFGYAAIVQDVVATADGFVAAGAVAVENRFAVWRSDDGIEWREVPTSGLPREPTEGGIEGLGLTPFGLVGVVATDEAFWSTDGGAWSPLAGFSTGVPSRYVEVTQGGSRVAIVSFHVENLT